MRKIRIVAYICLLAFFAIPFWGAQHLHLSNDMPLHLIPDDSIPAPSIDPSRINRDSIPADSIRPKNGGLEAIVDYKSTDSLVMTKDNWGYLYGKAEINYDVIKLTGEVVSMNMDSSIVEAIYSVDSLGQEFGFPVFTDGGADYETKTMKYNFKSKKGYSQHLVTQQGEGYVVAGKAKKNEDNSFFMREGRYTTCDDHDHPHFYLALTKAKVKPKKNVVTGPAYLVIEDLHIPFIGLPFGFFPFTDSYSSGVIMPSYGDEMDRGFNLHDGGYYFAINDYMDLKLLGTIYTKGSWALSAQSSYRKRYKYSGNYSMGYQVSKYGDKGLPDYSATKDFKLSWHHSQDPKANMFRTLSASVDFSTQSYDRNNLNTQYTSVSTQNTKGSSVSFTQRFPDSPWSFSGSANVNQQSRTGLMSATLPNMTITMSRVSPFKRKNAIGPEKWYEKIQISYNGDFRNSVTRKEKDFFKAPEYSKDEWQNAMQHRIPITATYSVFNYLNITPSVNYTERWYTSKVNKPPIDDGRAISDTISSFNRVYDFNANLGFQTKLYGFYTPVFSKTTQIRHVFTPSVSFSYAPDFSDSKWGFYNSYHYYDGNGNLKEGRYTPYANGMFGAPPGNPQGMINFSFENNVEMKIASESDSTGFKKISLIDNLGINFSHNLQADSLKWSDIGLSMRLKLSKSFTINLNAVFDPYTYGLDDLGRPRKIDKLRVSHGKGIARLKSTSYSISPSINQDTFNKWFGGNEKNKSKKESDSKDGETNESEEKESLLGGGKKSDGEYDEDGYIKNAIKWSLSPSFSMSYGYSNRFDEKKMEYKGRLTKNFSLSGSIQPTKNWSFNFNSTYDFDTKSIPYLSLSLTRDLHCWSISGSVMPVGQYKSYYVSLRANSSMLQDLKQEFKGRASSYDPNWD